MDIWHKSPRGLRVCSRVFKLRSLTGIFTGTPAAFTAMQVGSYDTPLPTLSRFRNLRDEGFIPWHWTLIVPRVDSSTSTSSSSSSSSSALPDITAGLSLSGSEDLQNPVANLKPSALTEVHLNFHSPELSLKCLSTILQVNIRLTSGTKTSLEQWSGPIGQLILHEAICKRTFARELLVLLNRVGKRFDTVKEIMNGAKKL
jgi:hypothetical protein